MGETCCRMRGVAGLVRSVEGVCGGVGRVRGVWAGGGERRKGGVMRGEWQRWAASVGGRKALARDVSPRL